MLLSPNLILMKLLCRLSRQALALSTSMKWLTFACWLQCRLRHLSGTLKRSWHFQHIRSSYRRDSTRVPQKPAQTHATLARQILAIHALRKLVTLVTLATHVRQKLVILAIHVLQRPATLALQRHVILVTRAIPATHVTRALLKTNQGLGHILIQPHWIRFY